MTSEIPNSTISTNGDLFREEAVRARQVDKMLRKPGEVSVTGLGPAPL
jgi:hypothetical protein